MGIVSVVVAASVRNNRKRRHLSNTLKQEKKSHSFADESLLSRQWLKQLPVGCLDHIDVLLLEKIDAQIRQISKKELQEPELKKTYLTLVRCLSDYRKEAASIYSTKENLYLHTVFLILAFGLPWILCLISSVFFLPMLPLSLALSAIAASFISTSLYAANELREKHPANETKLHVHFSNFMSTLKKYRENKSDNNSAANSDQPSANTPPYSNKLKDPIDASNLYGKVSLFNLENAQQEQAVVKEKINDYLKPQQRL